jgi:putative exporter of polyketide antibiotics
MLRSVLLKTLRDQRRGLIAWATSIVLLVMMYGSFWPSIRDQLSLKDFLAASHIESVNRSVLGRPGRCPERDNE